MSKETHIALIVVILFVTGFGLDYLLDVEPEGYTMKDAHEHFAGKLMGNYQ